MRTVVVVGGGLAGMVVARDLARRGLHVILLERSQRLGGKAGADMRGGRPIEHGYHVFPKWYPNVRKLLEELKIELVDFDRYHYLLPGGFPEKITVRGQSSPATTCLMSPRFLTPNTTGCSGNCRRWKRLIPNC